MRLVFLCIFSSQRYVICACGANSGNCPKILPRQRGVLYRVSDNQLGSVWSIYKVYAVNSFDGGDIADYGDFSDVKQLNIDGEITQNGDKISFSSPDNQKVFIRKR